MEDLNMIDNPFSDKTSRAGSVAGNIRLVRRCGVFQISDALRTLHPTKREYTFMSAAKQASTRIDRALISRSLLPGLESASHKSPDDPISDHGSAIRVAFRCSVKAKLGPGVWRFPSHLLNRPGVRKVVEAAAKQSMGDYALLLAQLNAGLRAYAKEEGKRVKATMRHLSDAVANLKQAAMGAPNCTRQTPPIAQVASASLPASTKEAVTILLHKKGDKGQISNYQPITLLNFTYQVLAKVVADRMKKVLHRVISKEQYGFIPGRRLSDAVSLVADIIDAANKGDKDWFLLLVDFQKAFLDAGEDGLPSEFCGLGEGPAQGNKDKVEAAKQLGIVSDSGRRMPYLGYAEDTTLLLQGREQIAEAGKMLDYFENVYGNHASEEGCFILWGKETIFATREEGGVGVKDPGVLVACLATRRIGILLTETDDFKRDMMLAAAGLPLGVDTFLSHEKLLKYWVDGSARWKQTCECFMSSSFATVSIPLTAAEVVAERLVFNKGILLNGRTLVGGQKAAKALWEIKLGDLVAPMANGGMAVKSEETLAMSLGIASARLALKGLAAAPENWRELLLASSEGIPGAVMGGRAVVARGGKLMEKTGALGAEEREVGEPMGGDNRLEADVQDP
ncbi:unnamed protein product [Closterium sp. NIES-65]|nr:unnamed protein product [Closterium sp. NIES-65]